jgi:hypothetical protein
MTLRTANRLLAVGLLGSTAALLFTWATLITWMMPT